MPSIDFLGFVKMMEHLFGERWGRRVSRLVVGLGLLAVLYYFVRKVVIDGIGTDIADAGDVTLSVDIPAVIYAAVVVVGAGLVGWLLWRFVVRRQIVQMNFSIDEVRSGLRAARSDFVETQGRNADFFERSTSVVSTIAEGESRSVENQAWVVSHVLDLLDTFRRLRPGELPTHGPGGLREEFEEIKRDLQASRQEQSPDEQSETDKHAQ